MIIGCCAVSTRQMMVVVVNEYLKGGWLELGAHFDAKPFDAESEAKQTASGAVDAIVEREKRKAELMRTAVTEAAKRQHITLTDFAIEAIEARITDLLETGASKQEHDEAIMEALSWWQQEEMKEVAEEEQRKLAVAVQDALWKDGLDLGSEALVQLQERVAEAQSSGSETVDAVATALAEWRKEG
eukprot:3311493-Prymnesium_polylepis.1